MSLELERRKPFSLEAEQSVLGAVLIDPAALDTLTGIISADDFYIEEHRKIYSAMQEMYMKSRNIDVITLIDELVHEGVYDETGGKDYISQIAETVPSAANVKDYAKIVSDKSQLRSLIDITEEISEAAYTEQDEVEKLIEMALAEARGAQDNGVAATAKHFQAVIFEGYFINMLQFADGSNLLRK